MFKTVGAARTRAAPTDCRAEDFPYSILNPSGVNLQTHFLWIDTPYPLTQGDRRSSGSDSAPAWRRVPQEINRCPSQVRSES